MSYIKKFEVNQLGNDYVVGDIHGMFSNLFEELKKINFNYIQDRLFSVGDLCDRGAESCNIIDLLEQPWFHPVMGNHEQILFLHKQNILSDLDLINMGAEWWLHMPQKKKNQILSFYQNLPIAIEVLNKNMKKIGIVHAECPFADWLVFEKELQSFNASRIIYNAMWSTRSPHNDFIFKNIDAIVVGHMAQKEYIIRGNTHLIDTGSGYVDGKITILDINKLQLTNYKDFKI